MKLHSTIFALLALPLLVRSDFPPCRDMPADCKPKMLQLKTILTAFSTSFFPPLSEMHNLQEELCQETSRCFSNCQNALISYGNACKELRTHMHGLDTECIPKVFEGLLIHKEYDLFTIDPSSKRKTFNDGKSTFMSMASAFECKPIKWDRKYESIMDLYTIPPVVREKCNTPYDKFQKMQCEALLNYFPTKILEMNDSPRLNVTELDEYSKRCQDCIDNTCLMQPQKAEAEKWKALYSGKKHIFV